MKIKKKKKGNFLVYIIVHLLQMCTIFVQPQHEIYIISANTIATYNYLKIKNKIF